MEFIKNMPYNKPILIDDNFFDGIYTQRLYIEKTLYKPTSIDQYFIKLFVILPEGKAICQGYIYFYLDFDNKESKFIGAYIKPEYRNKGYAALLTSNWIKLCLDNGFYNLATINKQRKPFLLYILKTYYFDLKNKDEYEKTKYAINVCNKPNDANKYLLFQNPLQKEAFIKSSIFKEDNYCILDTIDDETTILDTVILSNPHYMQDDNQAYTRSLKCIERKRYPNN